MKPVFVVLFAVCVIASAMVPRDRRAVDTEDQEDMQSSKPSTICNSQTPCGWNFYDPGTTNIFINITNSYCECAEGSVCQKSEDDTVINGLILRCRPPAASNDLEDTNSDN